MFVVKIQGGLENQLFQYAFGRYLEKTHPQKKVVYDVIRFKQQSKREFHLSKLLACKIRTIDSSQFLWKRKLKNFSTFREIKTCTFDKTIQNIQDNTIFDGYFQHCKYLEPIKEELRKSLRIFPITHKYHALKEKHSLIALYIRRGDYIADEKTNGLHGYCSLAYYTQTLEEIQKKVKNPHVLIFSDDIAWVKENFRTDILHTYVDDNHPRNNTIASFALMRFCDHFIIANSSFSWLAAFLGSTKESKVLAPYFFNLQHNAKTKQNSPPGWKALAHQFAREKSKMPQVSIIIPVYNVEKYLARCLESVCNQSLQDIEIIVVNDCSPDNSEKIIHEYQKRDARITYIKHKKNLNIGGARNSGIRRAKADWLLFVDSDDWIHRDMALTMREKALQHKVKVVICNMLAIVEKSRRTYYYSSPLLEDITIKNPFFHFCYRKKPHIQPAVWDTLWHRSLFTEKKIYFFTRTTYEDSIITPSLLREIHTCLLIPQCFYFYFEDRDASIMNEPTSTKLSRLALFTRCLMKSKKKFAEEKYEIQKAYEYFLEKKTMTQYSEFTRQISEKEHLACMQAFIRHFGEYGIRAVTKVMHNRIQELSENRWYKFGKLSKKEKIKFLLTFGTKKILQKTKTVFQRT